MLKIIQQDNNKFLLEGTDINLKKTFSCGQCFRWHPYKQGWTGIVNKQPVYAIQAENGIILEDTTIQQIHNIWIDYFDLERNYSHIIKYYDSDPFILQCYHFGKGIHILHQDPLETIISFIFSANNNIKRIQQIIENFCYLYGTEVKYKNKFFYTFPSEEQLKNITLESLQQIKAGFRDKYIIDFICRLTKNPEFISQLANATTEEARQILLQCKGIGNKICDCILLFAFQRFECFPKDVWINRITNKIYGKKFDQHHLGAYAGLIQQYYFYYGRSNPAQFS